MPGTTAGGLPYPLGTEPVRDGDNAIKSLADALQARGSGLLWQSAGLSAAPDVAGRFRVNFPKPFATQPWIAMTPGSSRPEFIILLAVDEPLQIDVNGFNGVAHRLYPGNPSRSEIVTGQFYMTWIAAGVAP